MFEKIKETYRCENRLIELDKILLAALFKKPIDEGEIFSEDIEWLEKDNPIEVDSFIENLLLLSEFYSKTNAVLSAALWGIWNAISYLRKQRSFLSIIFESEKQRKSEFIHYRGLVSTAIVQFSNGSADTTITSTALNDLPNYEQKVFQAIKILEPNSTKK